MHTPNILNAYILIIEVVFVLFSGVLDVNAIANKSNIIDAWYRNLPNVFPFNFINIFHLVF